MRRGTKPVVEGYLRRAAFEMFEATQQGFIKPWEVDEDGWLAAATARFEAEFGTVTRMGAA